MAQGIALDPAEFIDGRKELVLPELGLDVLQEGADWGESQIEAQLARQAIGATVISRHLEPVEMSIPLTVREDGEVSFAEASNLIESKVGRWHEEGGWIRRDFEVGGGFSGSVGYQILRASLVPPQGWLAEHRQVAVGAVLNAVRQPICYALVESESSVFESDEGARELVFELASILGTAPGLIRLRITNDGEVDLRGLILAGECRDHPQDATADTTAALSYAAADLTLKGGSEVKEVGGVDIVENDELTAGWLSILNSEITAEELGHMTHRGVRRLWFRAEVPNDNEDDVQFRLRWRVLGSLKWSENRIVLLNIPLDYQLYDLGECRPGPAALGDQRWEWELQARAVSGAGTVRLHRVEVLPTEQYMVLRAPDLSQAADKQSQKSPGTVESNAAIGSKAWTGASNAKASDDSRATAVLSAGEITQYLAATNFGFALSEGATPIAIFVEVERSKEGANAVLTHAIRLMREGSIIGDDFSLPGNDDAWLSTDTYVIYDSKLGGVPWTAGEINHSGFGAAIAAESPSGATARVDHIRITVYYTEVKDESRICFAGRSIELRSDGIFRQHPTDDVWGELIPEGFLPFATPSGLEGRKARFIVIPSTGDLGELADNGDNPMSAQALVRPGYLFAREAA
jgi:hypothetical protein